MNLMSLMRTFTIRLRMIGAIGVVFSLLAFLGSAGMYGMLRIQSMGEEAVRSMDDIVQSVKCVTGTIGEITAAESMRDQATRLAQVAHQFQTRDTDR